MKNTPAEALRRLARALVVDKQPFYDSSSPSDHMPDVDLSRLIIRKRYLLRLKFSELKDTILGALVTYLPSVHGIDSWVLSEKSKNCFVFILDLAYYYALMKSRGTADKDGILKLADEYRKGGVETYFEYLSKLTEGAPFELTVHVVKATESESVIDTELKPVLYQKIIQMNKEPTEVQMQDSYLSCEQFMRSIFESGLSGTLISEAKMPIPKATTELLINDAYLRQITERLHKMLDEATGEVLISAWMGTELINRFDELRKKGIRIRIITGNIRDIRQDAMQKEKTKALKELIQILGKSSISEKPDFHGRFVIVDNKAIVGSMDMDSYSLSGTRTEYAIYTEDSEAVRTLRNYFNGTFVPMKQESENENQKQPSEKKETGV